MDKAAADILKRLADGEVVYDRDAPEIIRPVALEAERLYRIFNELPSYSKDGLKVLRELLKKDVSDSVIVRPPFICDYGVNIILEENVFINYGAYILDACEVRIGSGTMLGPCVHIYSADHPKELEERKRFACTGRPVNIGKNVWIGGNCMILPGVTIGDGSVIGAGSVVTKDVEPMTVVAGNPANFIRKL
jgi:Acetyltransferase (isoleucine patch superfamily)